MTKSIFVICCIIIIISKATAQEYTAQVGDTVTITVRERDWLSGTQTVDANGQITLPKPVGLIKIVGLTADQITGLLTERLRENIVAPNVFVLISPALRFIVHIIGEVRAPNSLEVMEGSSLQEGITKAGGFTTFSDQTQIKLIRKAALRAQTPLELRIDFTQFSEDGDAASNPLLQAGDVVIVPRLPKSERPIVMVIGAVNQPGAIPIEEPILLVEGLALAGGPSTNADLEHISRLSPEDNKYSRKQHNVADFLAGTDPSANPILSPGEIIFVPLVQPVLPIEPSQDTINLIGALVRPGSYPISEGERLLDAIYVAGGFTPVAAVDKVTIIRHSDPEPERILVNITNYLTTSDLESNPELKSRDTIYIPIQEGASKSVSGIQTAFSESMFVTVMGEVRAPSTYQVFKNATLLDILNVAGGPTQFADLEKVTIIRRNTQVPINLEKALQEGTLPSLFPIQANDTVRVPPIRRRGNVLRTMFSIVRDLASVTAVVLLVVDRL